MIRRLGGNRGGWKGRAIGLGRADYGRGGRWVWEEGGELRGRFARASLLREQ